ncbi:hypothetical protein LIQ25_11460 [Blautia glucerasea]|uniref:hypothetical protein n=1 Tax=Blautia TaxID=572511 RepID=UPI001570203D|nr:MULTISPECIES: hypothetical protein [Blautia]MCB5383066.1 hypothetical protein [Blautia glucerasea]NSJ70038.1 hypothetical protein [Blautia faecis]
MRKSDLAKVLKKTMLNVDYMLDTAIQEIGNVNLLKKEWVENTKDNTAYVYMKTESFEYADLTIRKTIDIGKKYGIVFTNKKDYLKNPDSKGKYGLFLLAEPDLKSVGFGDVTVEIFVTTPLLEKADEFNRVLNNLDENIICEIRNGEYAKILEQYERIAKTDRLGEFERRLEQKRRKETQDRYLQGYKNGTPGPYQRRITYMPPW